MSLPSIIKIIEPFEGIMFSISWDNVFKAKLEPDGITTSKIESYIFSESTFEPDLI